MLVYQLFTFLQGCKKKKVTLLLRPQYKKPHACTQIKIDSEHFYKDIYNLSALINNETNLAI